MVTRVASSIYRFEKTKTKTKNQTSQKLGTPTYMYFNLKDKKFLLKKVKSVSYQTHFKGLFGNYV